MEEIIVTQPKGKHCFILFASLSSSILGMAKLRLRLRFFEAAKWRRPDWLALTLPEAVTLKRLATALRVLELEAFLICGVQSVSFFSTGNEELRIPAGKSAFPTVIIDVLRACFLIGVHIGVGSETGFPFISGQRC